MASFLMLFQKDSWLHHHGAQFLTGGWPTAKKNRVSRNSNLESQLSALNEPLMSAHLWSVFWGISLSSSMIMYLQPIFIHVRLKETLEHHSPGISIVLPSTLNTQRPPIRGLLSASLVLPVSVSSSTWEVRDVGRTKLLAPPSLLNPARAGGLPDQVMRLLAYRKNANVPVELIAIIHWNVLPYNRQHFKIKSFRSN